MLKTSLVSAFALVSMLSGSAHAARTLTAKDNGKTVTVKKGQNLNVKLSQNGSTGYRWTVLSTNRTFGYPTEKFTAGGPAIGSSGTLKLTWKTKSPMPMLGTHSVKLGLVRPWEKNKKPAQTFSFKIKIVK